MNEITKAPAKSVGEDEEFNRIIDNLTAASTPAHRGYAEANLIAHIDSLLAARTAADAPAGWKLVPIEPTEAMYDALTRHPQKHPQIREEYRAMLAAAPVGADQSAHDASVRWALDDLVSDILLYIPHERVRLIERIHALRSQPAKQQGDSNE